MNETIERNEGAKDDGRGRRIAFVTFGCRLNKAEALDLEAQYAAAGWQIMDSLKFRVPSLEFKVQGSEFNSKLENQNSKPETPDLIIVRGCSVTAKAQRDCEKAIAHLRARFPTADLRITGCLPQASTLNPQPLTLNSQPSTLNPQPSTLNVSPAPI